VGLEHFQILEWSAHALYQIDMLTRINTQAYKRGKYDSKYTNCAQQQGFLQFIPVPVYRSSQ